MCTDAYREALTRDFSFTASPAPASTPPPSQRQAAEADPEGVVGQPLWRRTNPGQDDLESRGTAAAGAVAESQHKARIIAEAAVALDTS